MVVVFAVITPMGIASLMNPSVWAPALVSSVVVGCYVALWVVANELEDPFEDITPEVEDEGDEHQLFFTGSAVEGPATATNADAIIAHTYADEDLDGLPLGLSNTISTLSIGSGELIVTLRHLPIEDGNPVKTEGMAEDVAEGGFGSIAGESDAQVSFNIEIE